MARVATTTSTSLVAPESLTLLLEEDDDPQLVMLVEDEHGTEIKFSDAMPGTLGHSVTIGKIKAAIGDRDRIDVDTAGAFLHTPLLAASAFAYLPPLPSAEDLAYLEQLQPVVDLRTHGPVVIAQPPELSTNKPAFKRRFESRPSARCCSRPRAIRTRRTRCVRSRLSPAPTAL